MPSHFASHADAGTASPGSSLVAASSGRPCGAVHHTPAPILLDATNGCPGLHLTVRNRTAPICIGCERLGKPGPQIVPVARLVSYERGWDCAERRSLGMVGDGVSLHDGADCAVADQGCTPCELGGCLPVQREDRLLREENAALRRVLVGGGAR